MGRSAYQKSLEEEKAKWKYQTLTFKVFREVLPYVEQHFHWWYSEPDGYELLLYYVAPKCRAGDTERYLVDIPYWKARLFHAYHKRFLRRQLDMQQREAIQRNSSTLILEDVQKALEDEIRKNLKTVQQEAAKHKEIAQRLSPFEHDYIKSQIEVEV